MALSGLRKVAKTPLGKGILIVIGITFFSWGASTMTGSPNRAVAVVGGVEIPSSAFQSEYERTMQRLSQERGGRISISQAKEEQIPQGVLGNMIVRQAIQNHARSIGVTTSDAEAIKQIKSIEAFNGLLGKFDEATFINVLRQSGFSRSEFESNVRSDIVREQMTSAVVSGMSLPRGMAEAIVRNRLERRNASYIVLAPDLAGRIETPSDEILRLFYLDRISNFTADESRDISFITMGPEDFTAGITIPEEDLKDLYDQRISTYTTPGTRNIERLFGSRQEMIAAKARIESGESFTSVGASHGLEADAIVLGDIDEYGITDTAVAKAAFEAEGPGLIGPIEGLSWSLVRINSITPESTKSFADVRSELRDELVLREADRTLGDNIDIIDEAIASGQPLEAVAKKVGLPLNSVKKIGTSGTVESGGKPGTLPDDPSFLEEVFASVKNFDSDLIEFAGNHYFVVRVDEIYPSAPRPFEVVRDDVEKAWRTVERSKRLVTLASSILDRARAGEDFAKLGNEVGRGVLEVPNGLGKNQTTDLFNANLLSRLFASKDGAYFHSPIDLGESLVVMRAGNRINAKDDEISAYVDIMKQQLDASFVNDAEKQYLNAVRNMFKSKQNPDSIALAIGDIAPSSF